jgi:hypothetical protein
MEAVASARIAREGGTRYRIGEAIAPGAPTQPSARSEDPKQPARGTRTLGRSPLVALQVSLTQPELHRLLAATAGHRGLPPRGRAARHGRATDRAYRAGPGKVGAGGHVADFGRRSPACEPPSSHCSNQSTIRSMRSTRRSGRPMPTR